VRRYDDGLGIIVHFQHLHPPVAKCVIFYKHERRCCSETRGMGRGRGKNVVLK
jgi:hypothetical protein